MKRLAIILGLTLTLYACGDDGKLKMYESCSSGAQCTEDLVCIVGACTSSCSVDSGTYNVGECPAASECAEAAVGCCLLTIVADGVGQGNCTINPPLPAG